MRRIVPALLAAWCAAAFAQDHAREIQRALIQRDQQSAEFALQLRQPQGRAELEALHARQLRDAGRPLSPEPEAARQLRPYERERLARESEGFVLRLPPPVPLAPGPKPAGKVL
jgi:hypothetical protein